MRSILSSYQINFIFISLSLSLSLSPSSCLKSRVSSLNRRDGFSVHVIFNDWTDRNIVKLKVFREEEHGRWHLTPFKSRAVICSENTNQGKEEEEEEEEEQEGEKEGEKEERNPLRPLLVDVFIPTSNRPSIQRNRSAAVAVAAVAAVAEAAVAAAAVN